MLEKLEGAEKRFEEINEKLCRAGAAADAGKYGELTREAKRLAPIVEKYRALKEARKSLDEANGLLEKDGLEKDFKELVREEARESGEKIEKYEAELKNLLTPRDPDDDKNVIVEIRAGAGGEEAALFAGSLFRMYSMYAESKGWKTETLNSNPTGLGGFKEISFSIEGKGAYSRLKFESGAHRVQRVPETESQGRIHTSAATVAVLPEAEEVETEINPEDLRMEAFRSGGAGGQHVNKTESAVRITHIPTGITAECQDERSQYKNREKAMKILRSRILEAERAKARDEIADKRKALVGAGDRSEKIRTYNYPQGRISDHRINLTLYKLEAALDGNLDEIIDALANAEAAERLENPK